MAPLSQQHSYKWGLLSVLALGIAIRAATSLHPYSGENSPPMYGDYEAQRHWMEITLHLPVTDWYRNTSQNDLSYWGLDYPPLSAYTSYLFGKVMQYVDSEAVALHSSRGYETPRSRAAMRATVLLVDIFLFFPAILLLARELYTRHINNNSFSATKSIFLVLVFVTTLPSFITIDHAHFQYNNFSLALFLLSVMNFINDDQPYGAIFYCASVYFKHMSLYYAPAIFAYLFSQMMQQLKHRGSWPALKFVSRIIVAIIATTLITFSPWLADKDSVLGLLRRLFPLSRGLYEDKVANLWCSISFLIKLNVLFSQEALFTFCALVTLLASLPFCVAVYLKPSALRLLLSASGCSLSAFLFSYQVHEKQILIPLLPLAMLYPLYPTMCTWMSLTTAFSLFPLLLREESATAYVATIILHLSALYLLSENVETKSHNSPIDMCASMAILAGGSLNLALIFGTPPNYAPDLFVLTNTISWCSCHMSGVSRHTTLARRGTWRRTVALSLASGVGIAAGAVCLAHWESGPNLSESTLRAIPLNTIGIVAHYVAKIPVPTVARPTVYKGYCSALGCDIPEHTNLKHFRSLAEFFSRDHPQDSRPLDQSASLVVPCDGRIIAAGPIGPYGSIDVKGVRYRIRDLVAAEDREPLAVSSVAVSGRKESGSRLWFTVIHIQPGDYHRFSSPGAWTLMERRHVSGYLLWMRPATEGLYTQNERVAFLGKWTHGLFSMTAVGAAGRGSIGLNLDDEDEELFRPTLRPTLQEISKQRYTRHKDMKPGERIGKFLLGSAIVLVFEAPENGFRFTVGPGDSVKMGEELATVSTSENNSERNASSDGNLRLKHGGSRTRFRRAW